MSERSLTILRDDVAARLDADDWFSTINVLTERKADIVAAIERSLGAVKSKGGKSGSCVIVMSPVASDEYPDAPFAALHPQLTVRVLENPLINNSGVGTGKEALSTAKRVVLVLKHFTAEGVCSALIPDKPTIVPVADPVAPVAYEVRFRTMDASVDKSDHVADPAVAPSGGAVGAGITVTISCTTSGAAIYYTTDGSFPWTGNPQATLYSAPFLVNTPGEIRAGAFKAGAIASNVRSSVFV